VQSLTAQFDKVRPFLAYIKAYLMFYLHNLLMLFDVLHFFLILQSPTAKFAKAPSVTVNLTSLNVFIYVFIYFLLKSFFD